MLDLIGFALRDSGITFCRLDGSMQRSRRDEALHEYRQNPQCAVILISLMAGGVGYIHALIYPPVSFLTADV